MPNIREMLRLVSREEDWGEWTRAELSGQSEEQKAECKQGGSSRSKYCTGLGEQHRTLA